MTVIHANSPRVTSSVPVITAPAMTAWSLGNEGSVLRVANTKIPGSAVYGRASCTCKGYEYRQRCRHSNQLMRALAGRAVLRGAA